MRFEAKVRERIVRTPDIISIRFDRAAGFEYMPGQYIFVTIYSGDEKMTKHLTISSSPTEPDHLEVTKRLTGHPYSNALSELREGDKVTLDGPFGSGGLHLHRRVRKTAVTDRWNRCNPLPQYDKVLRGQMPEDRYRSHLLE